MNRRGRVPFALIGVLLLVSSGAFVATMHAPIATEPAVEAGLDRLAAESQTALRAAVQAAARDAARQPVVVPANSTVGDALDPGRTFEDVLRLRIYLAARDHLRRLATTRRGVALRAVLPPVHDESAVPSAIERVHLARVDGGRAIAVRIEGARLLARSGGAVLAETRFEPDLVVETPILALHDRVARFERRLTSRVGQPGVATRLTAALYPVAWARGFAQFRGAPIENVVANRHVALLTNWAVLGAQRAAFGASDPVGRHVYRETLRETAVTDLLRATNASVLATLERLAEATGRPDPRRGPLERLERGRHAPSPTEPVTVGINRTADLAYARAVRALNESLAATYRPAGRIRATVRTLARKRLDAHDPPPAAGLVLDTYTSNRTTVRPRTGVPPQAVAGWHRIDNYSRHVVVRRRTAKTWDMPGNRTTTTVGTVRFEKAVDLLVAGNHSRGPAPHRPIPSVHRPGGPLDGPNLADAPGLIRDHLVADRGGPDALAARAALGRLDTVPVRVDAARPAGLAAWTRPDLATLHDAVRQLSVEVTRGDIATFGANVPARLAEAVRAHRARLVDAPAVYGSVARRARVGVRAAYVDRVLEMLEARARQYRSGRRRVAEALPDTNGEPVALMATGYAARSRATRPASAKRLAVDASPSYLTLAAVDHETVPAIAPGRPEHPLVARNVNAFSLPTTELVDDLFGLLAGPDTTSLRSAAQVLIVGAAAEIDRDGPFGAPSGLDTEVHTAIEGVTNAIEAVLRRHSVGSGRARTGLVADVLDEWRGRGPTGAALANGSVAAAVYDRVVSRWPEAVETPHARKRLAIELEFAVETATGSEFIRPRAATVNHTATRFRRLFGALERTGQRRLRDRIRDRLQAVTARRAASLAARLPSGVPVVPAPGMWYATVNAWHVQVRGSYARFAVRARHGAPDRLPASLTYVREARTVRIDVDADGHRDAVGANRRLAFATETVIGVAVPPQPQGVGDVTARDERSAGWPEPGADK